MPTVTRLRDARSGRVAVELDGAPWRTLPVDVVARAGLTEGRALDRPALRLLRQELRRAEALTVAGRGLNWAVHCWAASSARTGTMLLLTPSAGRFTGKLADCISAVTRRANDSAPPGSPTT